jgi:carbon monoxide dehydrogenase subunit G
MADRFEATELIDRPIEQVFDFLLDGENDKKFSSRVLAIEKKTDGPIRVGTVFASTVKDAGIKTEREFELDAIERPTRIRWHELSTAPVFVPGGGYDLAAEGTGARVTLFNELEGQGIGKLIKGFALRSARKSADGMVRSIKTVIEAELPAG